MTGTVTSPRSARLSPATSGQVLDLYVDAGASVAAGDVLLKLDPELAELELRSEEARLLQTRRSVEDAQRRLREARELIPQASIAESTVRDLEAEVALDEAALQQVTAEAALRRAILERHSVRAPFDGVVSAKLTELGEWVTPGTAVLELVATENLRLDFPVVEDFIDDIGPGASVRYSLAAGREYPGEVHTIVPVTDPRARTFLLRVLPTEDAPALRPGMSVTASLSLPAGRAGVTVPRDALLRYPDGRTVVWVVIRDGNATTVRERLVRTGLQFEGQIEVISGVAAGDRIVVEGNEALRDGQRVNIRPRAAGAVNRDV
jgi:membrane fusion protein (multidrug efflux system)